MSVKADGLKIDWGFSHSLGRTKMGDTVEILQNYESLGWKIVSGDMSWDQTAKKGAGAKKFLFHSSSWRDDPQCKHNSSGYALLTGPKSGITAIDVDDPKMEHNAKLTRMCEEAGAIKQVTRKGTHFIFQYTDRLKTTTSQKLALDIRNNDALLYCEPSKYVASGKTYRYKWTNLPDEAHEIPVMPNSIIEYVISLYKPNFTKEDKKKITASTKKDATNMDKMKADISTDHDDIQKVVMGINKEHAENYDDWVKVGIALYHAKVPWTIWDEFSKRTTIEGQYEEGRCFYTFQSFKDKVIDDPITIKTLYWWLKQENPEVFATLINQEDTAEYLKMKEEFERDNFIVGTRLCHLHQNGSRSFINDTEARLLYANKEYKVFDGDRVKKQSFYSIWLKDPKRKQYDRMDFCPDVANCPDNVYNLFKGLRGESLSMDASGNEIEMTDAEITEAIAPVLYHVSSLTSGKPEYFLKWMANIIQKPHIKSQTSIVLRDVSQMLKPGGGTGKNMFIEWFGEKLLGDDYFLVLGNNSLLYDNFSEHLENKLLVYVEEAKGRDNVREIDSLKASITSKTKMINRKGVPKYQQNDFTRYIWGTNNENPLPSYGATPGDRRFWFTDVDTKHRNDTEHFSKLNDHLELPSTQLAFYQYLKKYETWIRPIDFQTNRPLTQAYVDMRKLNADLILRWVITRVETEEHIRGASSDLFKEFQDWMTERNERKADECHISLTYFIQYLTRNSELIMDREAKANGEGLYKSSTSHIRLDTGRLRKALEEHNYIYKKTLDGYGFVDEEPE
jgi:hypothetical protein|nr:MAG: hypothetical protein [Lake Baikal virophage 3]